MAASAYFDTIQKMYIAYFGRPADPIGLDFWANKVDAAAGNLDAVINGFAASNESQALFGNKTSAEKINAIYTYLFNRPAEPAGLTYWVQKLDNGEISQAGAMYTILSNAGAGDVDAIANKLAVAKAFTAALDTNAEILGYSGAAAAEVARTYLTAVNSTAATKDAALAALDATVANVVIAGQTNGQSFNLTSGTDNIVGTSNNDVIYASTGLSADGATAIATTGALDKIDGGAGVDTLVIENTGGKNTLTGTITNVENLTFIGAGNVNDNADVDLSSFSGVFTLSQSNDTAVAVTSVTGQTLALNKVADGTTLTATLGAAQATATLSNTAAVGDATFSIAGAKLETVSVSTDKTATSKTLQVTDTGNTTKTFNIAASAAAAVNVTSTAVENINVTGAGAVTLTAGTAPSKTLSSANSTGGVTYAATLGADVLFTGGAGKDSIVFGATTKAQTMGAGDDVAELTVALGTGGTVDGGEGVDTLKMTATLAATLDDNTDFNAKVSSFEKLHVTAATNQTLNLTNLDGINYVIAEGIGNTLTIDNMASGGTFEFRDASTATVVNVKDAAAGTSDVVNVKVSAAANTAAGTLTVANVETVKIDSDDTATTPAGTVVHTLTLTADKATSVVVTGDAQLNLTLTGSTKVTSIDASGNTAGLTTNLSVASGITLKGTAKADTITLGNLSVVTGGEGKDAYTVSMPTNGNTYATITDFAVGETIQFTDKGDIATTALGDKISLASTAAFADYLAAATAGDATTDAIGKWFQFGGDTYVVLDRSAEVTFQNGADQIVKLSGALDLSKSAFSADGLFTFAAA